MATAKKGKGKSTGAAKSTGGAKSTGNARGGLAKPVQPDSTLAKVVGNDPLTRAALTKKVWDYVKKNDLQDPKDKRSIRADDKLRPVFGGKDKVSMFEMTKLVNQHVSSA
jgi:upstream activation factor subunit UAF30